MWQKHEANHWFCMCAKFIFFRSLKSKNIPSIFFWAHTHTLEHEIKCSQRVVCVFKRVWTSEGMNAGFGSALKPVGFGRTVSHWKPERGRERRGLRGWDVFRDLEGQLSEVMASSSAPAAGLPWAAGFVPPTQCATGAWNAQTQTPTSSVCFSYVTSFVVACRCSPEKLKNATDILMRSSCRTCRGTRWNWPKWTNRWAVSLLLILSIRDLNQPINLSITFWWITWPAPFSRRDVLLL